MIGIDPSVMLNYLQLGTSGATVANPSVTTAKAKTAAPLAPWDIKATLSRAPALAKKALAGASLINGDASSHIIGANTTDYGKLFTIFQGINGLTGLASSMQAKGITATEKARIQAVFEKGQKDINTYLDGLKLDKMDLTRGAVVAVSKTSVGVPRLNTTYKTGPIYAGTNADSVPAFAGDVQFDLSITRFNRASTVHIDLAEMGSTTRSMNEVVSFLNRKLTVAGSDTRFEKISTPDVPKTIQSGGKPVTLPAGPDKWSLGIKGVSFETLSFSAPASADAVYLTQRTGIDSKVTDKVKTVSQQELLKFQSDSGLTGTPPEALQRAGESNFVAGRVFSKILGPEITSIQSSQTAADGSVYMLANITGKTGGQETKGTSDVALMKYDSGGNLIYSRTLGASDNAKGLALAVSADGQVAIAGQVTGGLNGVLNDSLKTAASTDTTNSTGAEAGVADSFVSVFNAAGEEVWTRRRATKGEDQALSVTFGTDNSVYVAGRTKGSEIGAANAGGWDGYVQGFSWDTTTKAVSNSDGTGTVNETTVKSTVQFASQIGTIGDDKAVSVVVDGNGLLVASKEANHAVIRRYELQGNLPPILTATRDLGDLQGGDLTGMALNGNKLVLVGSSRDAAFSGANVTHSASGGMDAFGLSLSKDLVASTGDKIAFIGGIGEDTATAMTVSGGKVWIAGTSKADITDMPLIAIQDGFLSRLDIETGTQEWSRRFTAKDGTVNPASISVAKGGASVLDRLGLPTGTIAYTDSTQLSSATSVRTGDSFKIRTGEGAKLATITIAAGETLASLTKKIQQHTGFSAKVEVVTDAAVSRLKITALSDRKSLELIGGPTGQDALESLGLPPGLIRNTGYDIAAKQYTVGLNMDKDLKLDTDAAIAATLATLSSAGSSIRNAYRSLATNLDPAQADRAKTKSATSSKNGSVPTYLKNQLANYQAGLDRLLNGG